MATGPETAALLSQSEEPQSQILLLVQMWTEISEAETEGTLPYPLEYGRPAQDRGDMFRIHRHPKDKRL